MANEGTVQEATQEEPLNDTEVLIAIAIEAQKNPTEIKGGQIKGFSSNVLRDLLVVMDRTDLWAEAAAISSEEDDSDEDLPEGVVDEDLEEALLGSQE